MTVKRRTRKNQHFGPPATEYKVGKGRPPKATRWQPSQSGNPKGRPHGAKSVKTVFQQALLKKIVIQEKGRECRVTALEAIVLRLISLALKGDQKAIAFILALNLESTPHITAEEIPPNATAEELSEIYRSMVRRVEG
jgi:hypothetical protein